MTHEEQKDWRRKLAAAVDGMRDRLLRAGPECVSLEICSHTVGAPIQGAGYVHAVPTGGTTYTFTIEADAEAAIAEYMKERLAQMETQP